MTTQRTVKESRALRRMKHESRVVKKMERLNDLLLSAIDETLKHVFNKAGAKVIYNFLENKSHLKREEIAEKSEDFSAGLESLLGSAAPMIERMILKNLCSKLRLKFEEKEGYGFSDYLRELRERR